MKEKKQSLVLEVGVGIIVLIFTLFGFVIKQDCDIDKIYLWCRLHPLSVGDIIGLILFYGGAVLLSGVWQRLGIELYNPENSSKWNLITFGMLALGIILIWNL